MVKIKRKVQKNLPQLIEWAWDNPEQVERRTFKSDKRDSFGKNAEIYFTNCGHGFYTHRVTDKDTFTVEVEEEINECSDIKRLAHYTVHGFTSTNFNKSIGELRKSNSLAFYIMNDDRTLTLIWTKEKGMVE